MKALSVRWSSKADQEYFELIVKVQEKWGDLSAQKLAARVMAAEKLIARYPHLFQKCEARPYARKCVVTPQTSMYYIVEVNEITIVSVFDNRQDPTKLAV